MFWDFLSLTPESIHQVTILFSDRGIPRTYRNMDGFSSHTYKWVNAQGKKKFQSEIFFFRVRKMVPKVGLFEKKCFWWGEFFFIENLFEFFS